MSCLINTLLKNFIYFKCRNLRANCSNPGCLVQIINSNLINNDGTGFIIPNFRFEIFDHKFLSCLLNYKNGLQTYLIEQIFNNNLLTTNIYPVTLMAVSDCNTINVSVIGTFLSENNIYAFIFGCNNCVLETCNSITASRDCEACLTFSLVQNPNNICTVLTIPSDEWFDISNYVDITGTIDSLAYYYFNTCNYEDYKKFDIYLNVPYYTSNFSDRNLLLTYTRTTGSIKINKCGPNIKILIYLCKTSSFALFSITNGLAPTFITGSCVDINALPNIAISLYGLFL